MLIRNDINSSCISARLACNKSILRLYISLILLNYLNYRIVDWLSMIKKILIFVLFALILSTTVSSATVYKWQEDGRMVYSQTPPPPGVEYEIVINKNIGNTSDIAKVNSNKSDTTLDERQNQRKQEKTQKKLLEESNRIKQENCAIAKQNMESLTSRGQVTLKDGDIYRKLTEEERQAKIQETQVQLDEFCQK